ncbi:hypothetical protein ACEWY4_012031 [Coilia grayii]|uniref:Uncharacterized protein n=1 Tax=Coilia grayii TaxID=363190 RepID=A0ABD1JZC2_9TELE
MSCMWKLSTRPAPRTTTESGSVLDNLRCVGHSALQHQGDTTRKASVEGDKRKKKAGKGSLKRSITLNFTPFTKMNATFLLCTDTRSSEPRQATSRKISSCSSQRPVTHWGLYRESPMQTQSTASQHSYGSRARPQTKREGVDHRRQERQRKPLSRNGRNSLKPVFPVLSEGPTISQCEGINPVSAQLNKSQVESQETKARTPVFRQHYEIMFQDPPWSSLKSSANLGPLAVSGRGTCSRSRGSGRATLVSVPSPCCSPEPLQLDGVRLQRAWQKSSWDKTYETPASGGGMKDLSQLMGAKKETKTGDDRKSDSEHTVEAAWSDLVSPSESIDGSRWDPSQFKVTVIKTNRKGWMQSPGALTLA